MVSNVLATIVGLGSYTAAHVLTQRNMKIVSVAEHICFIEYNRRCLAQEDTVTSLTTLESDLMYIESICSTGDYPSLKIKNDIYTKDNKITWFFYPDVGKVSHFTDDPLSQDDTELAE